MQLEVPLGMSGVTMATVQCCEVLQTCSLHYRDKGHCTKPKVYNRMTNGILETLRLTPFNNICHLFRSVPIKSKG